MKTIFFTLGLYALMSLAAAQNFGEPLRVEVPTEWVDHIQAGRGHAFAFQLGDTMAVVYLEFSSATDSATLGQVRFYTGTRRIVRFGRLIPAPQLSNRQNLGNDQWFAACFRVGSDGYSIIAYYAEDGKSNVGVRVAPGVFDPTMLTAMLTGAPARSIPEGVRLRGEQGSSIPYALARAQNFEPPISCYELAVARRRWWRRTTLVHLIPAPLLLFSGE